VHVGETADTTEEASIPGLMVKFTKVNTKMARRTEVENASSSRVVTHTRVNGKITEWTEEARLSMLLVAYMWAVSSMARGTELARIIPAMVTITTANGRIT